MAEPRDPRTGTMKLGTVMGMMVAFMVVGAPMVYYLWSTVNELLAGSTEGVQLGIAALILLLFLGLLFILSRTVRRLDERVG